MNDRYVYLLSRTQRILRELNGVVEGCDNILARTQSPLMQTSRGKVNPDHDKEAETELLRRRVKDAILYLKAGTQ